jgi:DHA3 family macrolide efflux protein-like MFS transporter
MQIWKALKQRKIRMLWSGQVFSAIGDEVYNIALVWYTAKLIGTNAGFVMAVQAGSIFVFSLIGGIWSDHRDHRKVMITADLIRGGTVLLLPMISFMGEIELWMLIAVAIVVSSLSAFFTPAMTAFLPQLIEERRLLQTTNGLMETTTRFARVVGPGLVALLSRFIPFIHYFSLDAFSFFISAWSIGQAKADRSDVTLPVEKAKIRDALSSGFRLTCKVRVVKFVMFSGAPVAAAWNFIFTLGTALLVRERSAGDIGALGLVVFGYGIGNLSSNLIISNFQLHKPDRFVSLGRIIGGCGYIMMALSTNIHEMMLCCAFAAIGGPMTDLGYVNMIQDHFRGINIARVHRFGMATSYAALLVVLLVSPGLFQLFSVEGVVLACAMVILISGLIGLGFFWKEKPAN